jgi:hypothetical protein
LTASMTTAPFTMRYLLETIVLLVSSAPLSRPRNPVTLSGE